jgi:hypothetical protein
MPGEWKAFRVGDPAPKGFNRDCMPLETVAHVAHLEAASRIVKDEKLRAGLIFDKSKLNQDRILVNWLSPNEWSDGYRYGNVRFQYNFKNLIKNMKYYWVEKIAYGVPACRILITSNDYTERLDSYEPSIGDGPWWYDKIGDSHYWNGNFCLEFMVERDLALEECLETDFVRHHKRFCNDNPITCKELGKVGQDVGAAFIARVLGERLNVTPLKMSRFDYASKGNLPSEALTFAVREIFGRLRKVTCSGNVKVANITAAAHFAKALLHCVAIDDVGVEHFGAVFESQDDLLYSCNYVISEAFHLIDCTSFFQTPAF